MKRQDEFCDECQNKRLVLSPEWGGYLKIYDRLRDAIACRYPDWSSQQVAGLVHERLSGCNILEPEDPQFIACPLCSADESISTASPRDKMAAVV